MASDNWIDYYYDPNRLTSRFNPMRGAFNLPFLRPAFDKVAVDSSFNSREFFDGIPGLAQANELLNPFQDEATGESRIAQGIGVDDFVWMEENARRGDMGGVLGSGANALAEPILAGLSAVGGAGTLAKGAGTAARGITRAAAPRVTAFADDGSRVPGLSQAAADAVRRAQGGLPSVTRAAAEGVPTGAEKAGLARRAGTWMKNNKGKTVLAAGLGGAAALGAAQLGYGKTLPQAAQDYYANIDPATQPENQGPNIDPVLAAITGNYAAQRALVEAQRDRALQGYGDDRMATIMDFINRYNTITEAQGGAVQGEFNALADRYGMDVGEIAAAGQAGAGGVNSVYGRAASRTRRRNRRPGPAGRTAVSGMTPVSGPLASAPGDMTARGRTIADYVGAQAEIAARDAGYDAASAREYGAALANTMGQDAAIAALAAEMGAKSDIQAQREALAQSYNDMLLGLQMQEAGDKGAFQQRVAESELEADLAEKARLESVPTFEEALLDPTLLATMEAGFTQAMDSPRTKEILKRYGISDPERDFERYLQFQLATQAGQDPQDWLAANPPSAPTESGPGFDWGGLVRGMGLGAPINLGLLASQMAQRGGQ